MKMIMKTQIARAVIPYFVLYRQVTKERQGGWCQTCYTDNTVGYHQHSNQSFNEDMLCQTFGLLLYHLMDR